MNQSFKTMATNIIKQVLTGHKNGFSVRKMAEMYSMSPTTVQRYLRMANEDALDVDALLNSEVACSREGKRGNKSTFLLSVDKESSGVFSA